MATYSFNDGWSVQAKVGAFAPRSADGGPRAVTLPHDAMIGFERSPAAPAGSSSGFFPGGAVEYTKRFPAPESWRAKRVAVEFESVYRDAVVFVNGVPAGHRPNGYTRFRVALDPYLRYGQENEIRVEARAHDDSRWYPGLGILRDTRLRVAGLTSLDADGPRITTPDVDEERAVVEVEVGVVNDDLHTRTVTVVVELHAPDGAVAATGSAPATVRAGARAVSRRRLYVHRPLLWDVDDPNLYTAVLRLDGDAEDDWTVSRFGIRTIRLDPQHGLRLNGRSLKLRGTCVHADNGVIGAATIARADERRVELLKAAGFNAIRSAHNPISTAMLDACDRVGVLVMDEFSDVWAESKSPFDYSTAFPEWWRRDLAAMVAKDFNHPSVVLYSIGNEILEAGKPLGAAIGRELAEELRALDPTRFITNGISGFVASMSELRPMMDAEIAALQTDGNVNDLMGARSDLFDRIGLSDTVRDLTAESHSVVDVVGHNYAENRYVPDRATFPDRVVVGTESVAKTIDRIWRLVEDNPHVIGDFTWTGWDYLGEAGLGRVVVATDDEAIDPPTSSFPWLLAWCGDIDITGHRRPASYYREIVFGLRSDPCIAVQRPATQGVRLLDLTWSWSDTTSSWSWGAQRPERLTVEVYSASDEVELLLNGRAIGTRPTGARHRFRTSFEVPYEPGELVAVGRTGDREVGRATLRSTAGPAVLRASADRSVIRADDTDLAFVAIELMDSAGTLETDDDRRVRVEVRGPGTLQGFGSADPMSTERFDGDTRTTFEGRALAVVRPTGAGLIVIRVGSDGLDPVEVVVEARPV